jgi:hypothetical protein
MRVLKSHRLTFQQRRLLSVWSRSRWVEPASPYCRSNAVVHRFEFRFRRDSSNLVWCRVSFRGKQSLGALNAHIISLATPDPMGGRPSMAGVNAEGDVVDVRSPVGDIHRRGSGHAPEGRQACDCDRRPWPPHDYHPQRNVRDPASFALAVSRYHSSSADHADGQAELRHTLLVSARSAIGGTDGYSFRNGRADIRVSS